ncbi:ATP-grasp domain-containing protein [Spirosoma koreense]
MSAKKKIGILFGQENTFPQAFVDRVNEKQDEFPAEFVSIEQVEQSVPTEYAVIIDRISQDVPFYKAYLKNAALTGTAVINNPFWWSADEKFFNNCLAVQLGVPVPKTILLPSKERPDDTNHNSFRNLKHMNWNAIFEQIGFPAFMKPHAGGGWKSVYKVDNPDQMFRAYDETGQLVMLYQEAIDFTDYFRCYCIGGKDVRIMPYEPRNPHHLRYAADMKTTGDAGKKLLATMQDYVLKLNHGLGYDFNTVEFAVRDGIPIAIDFCNPAPDADIHSVGQANFEWVVEAAANMAIDRAKKVQKGTDNLTWGTFVRGSVGSVVPQAPVPVKAEKSAKTSTTPKIVETPKAGEKNQKEVASPEKPKKGKK